MPDPGDDAILDATVLFPIVLCDLLLRCAEAELFRPRWTAEILDELERNVSVRIGERAARSRVERMRSFFTDATVVGYEWFLPSMTNEIKDRHVAAAAAAIQANVIVTQNLRDFPVWSMAPFGLRAQSADRFLCDLFTVAPVTLRRLMAEQAAAYRRPSLTVAELTDLLANHVPVFVTLLRREEVP